MAEDAIELECVPEPKRQAVTIFQPLLELSFEEEIEEISTPPVFCIPNENDTNISVITTNKKRNKFVWDILKECVELTEALDYLESDGFVRYDDTDLKCGQKYYFRCKLIPKERKTWCSKRLTLFLPSDNLKVIICRISMSTTMMNY